MNRTHLVAIAIGVVLITASWLYVVPLLLDLDDSNGQAAALGWVVLAGATGVVGWVMFRPPAAQPGGDTPQRKPRRGLRRSRPRKH